MYRWLYECWWQWRSDCVVMFVFIVWNADKNAVRCWWKCYRQQSLTRLFCKSASRSRQITTPVFIGWMPFLPPNQQRQSTEGKLLNTWVKRKVTWVNQMHCVSLPLGRNEICWETVCLKVLLERAKCDRRMDWVQKEVPNSWGSCMETAITEKETSVSK